MISVTYVNCFVGKDENLNYFDVYDFILLIHIVNYLQNHNKEHYIDIFSEYDGGENFPLYNLIRLH